MSSSTPSGFSRHNRGCYFYVLLRHGKAASAVYGYLVMRADKKGECWPSVATIADDLQMIPGTVREQIKRLVTDGLIESAQRTHKGRKSLNSNKYTIRERTDDDFAVQMAKWATADGQQRLRETSERTTRPGTATLADGTPRKGTRFMSDGTRVRASEGAVRHDLGIPETQSPVVDLGIPATQGTPPKMPTPDIPVTQGVGIEEYQERDSLERDSTERNHLSGGEADASQSSSFSSNTPDVDNPNSNAGVLEELGVAETSLARASGLSSSENFNEINGGSQFTVDCLDDDRRRLALRRLGSRPAELIRHIGIFNAQFGSGEYGGIPVLTAWDKYAAMSF